MRSSWRHLPRSLLAAPPLASPFSATFGLNISVDAATFGPQPPYVVGFEAGMGGTAFVFDKHTLAERNCTGSEFRQHQLPVEVSRSGCISVSS